MNLTQQEIEAKKLYIKLCGNGMGIDDFRGGLFEEKQIYSNNRGEPELTQEKRQISRIRQVISSLSEEDANNLGTLMLFVQQETKYGIGGGCGPYYSKNLEAWLSSPNVKMETKNEIFVRTADSFSDLDKAAQLYEMYQMFLSPSVGTDNPWTINRAQKPGYQVIPYFEVAGMLPGIVPSHARDQYAYRDIVNKIREENKEIIEDFATYKYHVSNLPKVLIHNCPSEKFQDIIMKYQKPIKISQHQNRQARNDYVVNTRG